MNRVFRAGARRKSSGIPSSFSSESDNKNINNHSDNSKSSLLSYNAIKSDDTVTPVTTTTTVEGAVAGPTVTRSTTIISGSSVSNTGNEIAGVVDKKSTLLSSSSSSSSRFFHEPPPPPPKQQQQQQHINGFLAVQSNTTTTTATHHIASAGSLALDGGPPAVAIRPTATFVAKATASALVRESYKNTTITSATASADVPSAPLSSNRNNNNNNSTGRATNHVLQANVQVCARIRPITIDASIRESESFFHATPTTKGKNNQKVGFGLMTSSGSKISYRKPNIPTTTSSSSSTTATSGSIGTDTSIGRTNNSTTNSVFVAWDVSQEATTASQSDRTEKIQGRTHSYTLDRIFGTESATKDVYDHSVSALVQSAMEGYHSTVLAYGQTSTGKTHTMTGTKNDPGLIPSCIIDCFNYVQNNTCMEPREYLFRLSYLEVYKEHIRDLLSNAVPPEPVRLFDGPHGLLIRGLKEEVVTSPEHVFALLKQGERRRQVGATHMNEHSSRSHVMVRLWIESSSPTSGTSRKDNDGTGNGGKAQHETRVSSLSLVDLAGSESVRLNGTDRREEGHYINKSLMTLGQVVLSLSDAGTSSNNNGISMGKKSSLQHIPYRDSKLTRLLQPSLSGNAQMVLLCCISPLASHLEESHNTFKFASRAKRIEQKATIQMVVNDEETLLQTYRDEIEDLKQQLACAKEQHQQLLESHLSPPPPPPRTMRQATPGYFPSTSASMMTMTSTTSNDSSKQGSVETVTEEVHELVKAIETMERLILKSRPKSDHNEVVPIGDCGGGGGGGGVTESSADEALASLLEGDEYDDYVDGDDDDLSIDSVDVGGAGLSSNTLHPTATSAFRGTRGASTEDQLHSELARIRGLLGSVLQKRGVVTAAIPAVALSPEAQQDQPFPVSLDFSTPPRTPDKSLSDELEAMPMMNDRNNILLETDLLGFDEEKADADMEKKAEVATLRRQLEKSEQTTNLRKADSSFLQAQLREKDQLLEEVSHLLEAVEQRQVELEQENAALRNEIEALKNATVL